MKVTAFLLMVLCLHVSASTFSQTTVSMKMRSSFAQIVEQIEKNTEFKFVIKSNEPILSKEVEVDFEDESMEEVLDNLLADTDYEYEVIDRYIAISPKEVESNNEQQQQSVSGKVTDQNGELLPGVTVIQKGTIRGTITDIDGVFTLTNIKEGDVLVFSFVGMKPVEVTVADQKTIDVTMQPDAIGLEEVVAIGYGTTTKRKMVGAISTLDTEKLEQTPYNNVGQALQGQVPGLIVKNNGGAPGSKPTISIRGGGDPLYVIDGVITNSQDFNAINSDDIESISFLKDASATAVYGSRAGDGIVLVTTKRGKGGKLSINYSYNFEASQPTVLPSMMNSYDYAMLQNAANQYDGTPPTYTNDVLDIIKNHENLDMYPDNNWPALCLKDYAPQQQHKLSLTGGDQKTNYFISLGYVDQGSILKEDVVNYNRLNVRSNVTTNFENIGLEVGVNVNASIENYQEPFTGMYGIWRWINQNTNPMFRAYNIDGTLAGGGDGSNPIAVTSPESGYNRDRDKFINAQLFAKWHVPNVKGLQFGVMTNYRDGDGWNKVWSYNVPLYMQDGSLMKQLAPQLSVNSYYNQRLYFESSASYANQFGKHGVEGTIVYNQTTSSNESMSAFRRDYMSGAVDQLFAGSTEGKDNNGNQAEAANAGYVVRMKYDYDYKYILEFSGRYDGNDNFAPNRRWGFFPAASLAWNITEEDFMQGLAERNIINNLKLRASYGVTGITQGVNRFGYISVYNLEPITYTIGNSWVNGYSEGNLVNPDELTWYTRNSLNYGLDFSTLNNRLSGSAEYFYYRTTGYLMSPKDVYSQPLGKDLPQVKSNSAHRRAGFELALRYKDKVGDFTYEVGFNYSYYNQLWEQLDTENEATLKNPYTRETHRTDYWQRGPVYQTDHLYQTTDQILNTPRLLGSTETQLGDMVYQDMNGDGKIDEQDKRTIGLPSFPHTNYGIDFSMGYKGWFMNGLFQGTGNRYMDFDHFMVVEAKRRTYEYQQDFWSPENTNAMFPRVSHMVGVNGGNNDISANPSDFYLQNAKYFRLKNLQIGYDLKKEVLQDVEWLSTCKVFVNGTNLLTFSPVMEYFDPEQVEAGDEGKNSYGYPIQRTISFGINVGF